MCGRDNACFLFNGALPYKKLAAKTFHSGVGR